MGCVHVLEIAQSLMENRLMQAAFDNAVEYVHDRKQFGQPVGTFQLMQGQCTFSLKKRSTAD